MPTKKPKKHPGVEKAIAAAGGSQQALARILKCPQSAISKRLRYLVPVTAEWAVEVEQSVPGVRRSDLRPDLWP